MQTEVGANHLDSTITGRSSNALTGAAIFPFLEEDSGVADTLTNKEWRAIDVPRDID